MYLFADKPVAVIRRAVDKLKKIAPLIKKFGLLPSQFNLIYEIIMMQKLCKLFYILKLYCILTDYLKIIAHGYTFFLMQCLLPRKDISEDYVIRIIASISRKDRNIMMTVSGYRLFIDMADRINRADFFF